MLAFLTPMFYYIRHFNHVYNFPRYAVLPGHEHKACMSTPLSFPLMLDHSAVIPYDNLFGNPSDPTGSAYPHKRIHGMITSLHPHHITYTPYADAGLATSTLSESPFVETTKKILRFDYAIYALGSHLPSPIDLWGSHDTDPFSAQEPLCPDTEFGSQCISHIPPYQGTKQESISRLRSRQQKIKAAQQVLVVGGGALGIRKLVSLLFADGLIRFASFLVNESSAANNASRTEFASDIAAVYPRKPVTLLHSRSRLLPRFDKALGEEGTYACESYSSNLFTFIQSISRSPRTWCACHLRRPTRRVLAQWQGNK